MQFPRDYIYKKDAALLTFSSSLGIKQGDKQGDKQGVQAGAPRHKVEYHEAMIT